MEQIGFGMSRGKSTDKKLNSSKIEQFIQSLLRLKVDTFLPSTTKPQYLLNRHLYLKDKQGVLLFHLSWSKPFSKRIFKESKSETKYFVAVRTNLMKEIFLMKAKSIENLKFSSLLPIPPKEVKKENKDKGKGKDKGNRPRANQSKNQSKNKNKKQNP